MKLFLFSWFVFEYIKLADVITLCSVKFVPITDENYEQVLSFFKLCNDLSNKICERDEKLTYKNNLATLVNRGKEHFMRNSRLSENKYLSILESINNLYLDILYKKEDYTSHNIPVSKNIFPENKPKKSEKANTLTKETCKTKTQNHSNKEKEAVILLTKVYILILSVILLIIACIFVFVLQKIREKENLLVIFKQFNFA